MMLMDNVHYFSGQERAKKSTLNVGSSFENYPQTFGYGVAEKKTFINSHGGVFRHNKSWSEESLKEDTAFFFRDSRVK